MSDSGRTIGQTCGFCGQPHPERDAESCRINLWAEVERLKRQRCEQPTATACAREWETDHQRRPVEEAGLADEFPFGCDTIDHVVEALVAARAERDKLAAFKLWCHNYLDGKGVPFHPPGTHGAAGCRIGDRMDFVWAELARLRAVSAAAEGLRNASADVLAYLWDGPEPLPRDQRHDAGIKLATALAAYVAAKKELP